MLWCFLSRDRVENESIYVAIGITPEGRREILGYHCPGGMESAYNWREILQI
ncbi:transposase [Thermospira aquatica]|uniref:Transposase n=1 Tax=Thermospira aquatica TaxID=2828656 RepID=A0AAX3BE31_9SPIR|nr:transposase [Thermospira aquatica]URA10532.1 transposase [Thermospira aquatica]